MQTFTRRLIAALALVLLGWAGLVTAQSTFFTGPLGTVPGTTVNISGRPYQAIAIINPATGLLATLLASVTEAATEARGGTLQAISSYLKADDGTTFSRVRGRSGLIGSSDFGLVTRPFMGSDGTNTMPTMDAAARPGYIAAIGVTTGGDTLYSTAWSTAAVFTAQIKGSAGKITSFDCFNNTTTKKYVRLYNQTGAPASTDTANIVWRGIITADVASNGGGGFVRPFPSQGADFGTGIGIRISGAVADNDTTALAANDVVCNAGYK